MSIEFTDISLAGVRRLQLEVHRDERGFFVERFQHHLFKIEGLPTRFAQENHSRSLPGVIRGLHFQHTPPQGKLVSVTSGFLWHVLVDIRPWSHSFGHYYAEELSGDNGVMFYVPIGFAHGFCVLGDQPADFLALTTEYYAPEGEGGLCFDDPDLGIPWPITKPIVSARDRGLLSWRSYCNNPPNWEME